MACGFWDGDLVLVLYLILISLYRPSIVAVMRSLVNIST